MYLEIDVLDYLPWSASASTHKRDRISRPWWTNLFLYPTYQVVVGSFLPGNQQEQKPKKQKAESIPAIVTPAPSIVGVIPVNNAEKEGTDGHRQQNSSPLKPNTASSPFRRDNWPTIQEPINSTTDINISLPAS